jgi:hypothetical protein
MVLMCNKDIHPSQRNLTADDITIVDLTEVVVELHYIYFKPYLRHESK